MVKSLPASAGDGRDVVQSLSWEDPLEGMATHFSMLPGEFHGQRSLVGCGPQDHRESDTTEVTAEVT